MYVIYMPFLVALMYTGFVVSCPHQFELDWFGLFCFVVWRSVHFW